MTRPLADALRTAACDLLRVANIASQFAAVSDADLAAAEEACRSARLAITKHATRQRTAA
jgi:hypothetical protein